MSDACFCLGLQVRRDADGVERWAVAHTLSVRKQLRQIRRERPMQQGMSPSAGRGGEEELHATGLRWNRLERRLHYNQSVTHTAHVHVQQRTITRVCVLLPREATRSAVLPWQVVRLSVCL